MADVVNLRLARKARDRAAKAVTAEANRVAFGRTRAERNETAAVAALRERALDGAKRED